MIIIGAPSTTWFCKNGHMVANYSHHNIPKEHDKEPCPICGERVWFVCEWGNPDYKDWQKVPVMPIENSDIPIYNVSNLFRGSN